MQNRCEEGNLNTLASCLIRGCPFKKEQLLKQLLKSGVLLLPLINSQFFFAQAPKRSTTAKATKNSKPTSIHPKPMVQPSTVTSTQTPRLLRLTQHQTRLHRSWNVSNHRDKLDHLHYLSNPSTHTGSHTGCW